MNIISTISNTSSFSGDLIPHIVHISDPFALNLSEYRILPKKKKLTENGTKEYMYVNVNKF